MFSIIPVDHFLERSGELPRLPRFPFIEGREELFAKVPGALERPGPAGQGAAALPHELARSVGVAVGIEQWNGRTQRMQIGKVA